jgi:hypothetical protein
MPHNPVRASWLRLVPSPRSRWLKRLPPRSNSIGKWRCRPGLSDGDRYSIMEGVCVEGLDAAYCDCRRKKRAALVRPTTTVLFGGLVATGVQAVCVALENGAKSAF